MGKKKGKINEVVDGLELNFDHRYLRGLSVLLDRRCQFESKAVIDPVKARRQVFKIAHEEGLPITQKARLVLLFQVATLLGVTVKDLEVSLYGDLDEELILKNFVSIDPEALVKQYNLSLTQTLLFHSTELTFTVIENWQYIFRQIKWLGLIYTIWRSNSGYKVKVDGPTSLFKLNRRYGTSIAKLLPAIVQSQRWSLNAKILRYREDRMLLNLELNNLKHGGYLKAKKTSSKTEVYDSLVEQNFANRFKALNTGWMLTREPEPLPVGKQVMIPDFSFQKGDLRVYMEVVGFWTPQYLEEKVKKLNMVDDVDMIVVADRHLACQKLDRIGKKLNVIYYHRKVPLSPILDYLKSKEARLVKKQVKRLRGEEFTLQKSIIEAKELAEKMGVLKDAMNEVLKEKEFHGYIRLGDMLITKTKLKQIGDKLEKRLEEGELNLVEASDIIENAGGRRPTSILDTLGYKVEWYGIDPKSAKISRKN